MEEQTTILTKEDTIPSVASPAITQTSKITTESTGPIVPESGLFNVSVRAWIALVLVFTVCVLSAIPLLLILVLILKGTVDAKEALTLADAYMIKEPLYSMSLLAVGFYFGQAIKKT